MQKLIKNLLDKNPLLSILSISCTLILLLLPTDGQPSVELFPHFDKIAHVAVFAACVFFLYIDLRLGDKMLKKRLKPLLLILFCGIIVGYLVEIIQGEFLGREYSLQDLAADGIGLVLGLSLATVIYHSLFTWVNSSLK